MKVFRDMCIAILLGIVGGFLVSTISYYSDHREGGVEQTLMAISKSFDVMTDAYSMSENSGLLLGEEDYNIDDALETFGNVSGEEFVAITELVLGELLSEKDMNNDVLVMDDEDGDLEEGAPYSGIMRFHVRANSDSKEDQALKIAVKEDVVSFLKPLLEDCKSVSESKNVIVSNLQNIYTISVNTIVEQGYDYPVEVYVTKEEFPAKTYGDLTFPAGDYQALRIDIGEAKGQNWWCVMYPPLCFIDDSTTVVSEEGKEVLQENLTPQEYADLFARSEVKVESRLWNWLQGE
jgi:stage II sporulation protein R